MSDDVGFAQRVADRVAAWTGAKPSRVHCWGCGKNAPWWACECVDAAEWQKQRDLGNKAGYPRFNHATGCIENLSEAVIRRNEALGYKRANAPPVSKPVSSEADRKTYMRDLMRQRRARQREGK